MNLLNKTTPGTSHVDQKAVANDMITRFSPWGNKIKKLKIPTVARNLLDKTFKLIPFNSPRWGFLKRDKKKENMGNPWLRGAVNDKVRYDPKRDDPFVFTDNVHYNKVLDLVRDGVDSMLDDFRKKGIDIENTDPAVTFEQVMRIKDEKTRNAAQMLVGELSIARKFTIQRRVPEFYYVNEHSPNSKPVSKSDQERLLQIYSSALKGKEKELRAFAFDATELADPLDTNSGAPFFKSGPEYRFLNAKLYQGVLKGDFDDVTQNYEFSTIPETFMKLPTEVVNRILKIARDIDVPPCAVIGCGSNKRTGPSRKPSPLYMRENGRLIAYEEVTNDVRGRQVFMVSYIYNLLTGPPTQALTYIRKRIPGFYFDQNFQNQLNSWKKNTSNPVMIESDFSAMDRTFTVELRQTIIALLQRLTAKEIPGWMFEVLAYHPWMSYLIPDFYDPNPGSTQGIACVPKQQGAGLYSGLKSTSGLDSNGGMIYIDKWNDKLGYKQFIKTLIEQGKHRDVFSANQGDDVLQGFAWDKAVGSSQKIKNMYNSAVQAAEELGFNVELGGGDLYLMNHTLPEVMSPNLMRILQQTISNEHQRKSFALWKLGFTARSLKSEYTVNALKKFSKGTDFENLTTKFLSYYHDVLNQMVSRSHLEDVVTSNDHNRDKERMNVIRKISLVINKDAQLKQDLQRELIADRYSNSTQQLMEVLKTEETFKEWHLSEDSKKKKLYELCVKQLTTPFNVSQFNKIIRSLSFGG
jgi:hypothetical protein